MYWSAAPTEGVFTFDLLADEYGLEVLWDSAEYNLARWIASDDPKAPSARGAGQPSQGEPQAQVPAANAADPHAQAPSGGVRAD